MFNSTKKCPTCGGTYIVFESHPMAQNACPVCIRGSASKYFQSTHGDFFAKQMNSLISGGESVRQ